MLPPSLAIDFCGLKLDSPIVLLSGAGGLATEAASLGAVAFLNKPFKLKQLLGVLEQHCGPPGG